MDEFHWWREALKGNVGEIHESNPQPGYYKMRDGKDGPWLPVAIWTSEGELVCRVAGNRRDALEVWTWCAKNPVSKADAKIAFETGSWPGDVPLSNSANLTLQEEIDDAVEQALAFLKQTTIADQISADKAGNWRQRLLDLGKKADKEREAEKRPHDEAAKAVQAKWKPSIDKAADAANTIRDALTKWMREEEAKRRAAAEAKAREENERRQRAQEEREKALAAAPGLADILPPVETAPVVAAEPVVHVGGQRGRKTALRTVTRFIVVEYEAALAHLKHHPEVRAAVEKVAAAQGRAGVAVPGVSRIEEQVAA
jgi:hypothetical protein